jgi:uncharacterized damage-inducible protein DinB
MSKSKYFQTAQSQLTNIETEFLRLVSDIPESAWNARPRHGGWTAKQQLVHMVQVVEILAKGIRRASTGGQRSWLSAIPTGLRSWINGYVIIPLKARGETRESIAQSYQTANQVLIHTLERLGEDDWAKGMPYPRQFRTVEQLAHRPVDHFKEHEAQLRQLVNDPGN